MGWPPWSNPCHSERSEESAFSQKQILRFAWDDKVNDLLRAMLLDNVPAFLRV